MRLSQLLSVLLLLKSAAAQNSKAEQLRQYTVNDVNQEETNSAGEPDNTTYSLRIGPRGYVLLDDADARKKMQHFTRERQPERVVHASGHGAFGYFTSYADWSNITSACWLTGEGKTTDTFSRFSVHNPGYGGSEIGRDTHGFATKIYSECGNQDLVFNHVPSFFLRDGIQFPDMARSIKLEPDKGFPTGGGYHQTAYDFFTHRPEAALQRMLLQSDLGIPIDSRHMRGAGVHTFRMINTEGKSVLIKWYWEPTLGLRSRVDDEVAQLQGYNADWFRYDTYNAIASGLFPEWELLLQVFPDDGSYYYKGIDLVDPTLIVPYELNPPIKLGKMTLNRNPTNWFAEVESVQFAVANVVPGFSNQVPDAVLQWRLFAYDDTATYRHGSPNYNQIPVNRPISAARSNDRDGFMVVDIPFSDVADSPQDVGGIEGTPESALTNGWTENIAGGPIGRYGLFNDGFTQASTFFHSMDQYAQQHVVNAWRWDMNHISNQSVVNAFISEFLNPIDNCLARRVAYGLGVPLPAIGTGSTQTPNVSYPSTYPLGSNAPTLPVAGLNIAVLAADETLTSADWKTLQSAFAANQLNYSVIAPRAGQLQSGVNANVTYSTGGNSVFYDGVILGSSTNGTTDPFLSNQLDFLRTSYTHGKPLVAIGNGISTFNELGYPANSTMGVFGSSSASDAANDLVNSLAKPGRYPVRVPIDDVQSICG